MTKIKPNSVLAHCLSAPKTEKWFNKNKPFGGTGWKTVTAICWVSELLFEDSWFFFSWHSQISKSLRKLISYLIFLTISLFTSRFWNNARSPNNFWKTLWSLSGIKIRLEKGASLELFKVFFLWLLPLPFFLYFFLMPFKDSQSCKVCWKAELKFSVTFFIFLLDF